MSRIMIAGTGSGSGKTTIVCGLCQCFKDMGLNISALKCGPDYIDSIDVYKRQADIQQEPVPVPPPKLRHICFCQAGK